MEVRELYSRDAILGSPSHHKISDLGMVQFRHDYDPVLLETIRNKAIALKSEIAAKRHLNLNYIRAAHTHIPEILELFDSPGRMERLEELAGAKLERYPISVVSTIVTFMGSDHTDGAVQWHEDGVPVTELLPLDASKDLCGGELQIYRGLADVGMALMDRGHEIGSDQTVTVTHKPGYSTLGQFFRVLHRTVPIQQGSRITLNLNMRSKDQPYIEDNPMYWLAADNPDFDWQEEVLRDVNERQAPAYIANVVSR